MREPRKMRSTSNNAPLKTAVMFGYSNKAVRGYGTIICILTVGLELTGLVPFDGDGHWYLCLDYRHNNTQPEITFIETESDYEKPIAKTFQEYLKLLEIDTDNEFVIETNFTIEELVTKISSKVDIKFEEPDSFAHGYPVSDDLQRQNLFDILTRQGIKINETKTYFK